MSLLELTDATTPTSPPLVTSIMTEAPMNPLNDFNFKPQKTELQDLSDAPNGQTWYRLDLLNAFTAGFNAADYNSGACNGGWKDARFMREPYITKSSNSITASVTAEAVNAHACIYQNT